MDPLWAMLAEGWWALPAAVGAVGAGAVGFFGIRSQRGARMRRLELDAAQLSVRTGRQALTRSRAHLQAARAAVARADADRVNGRATPADVADARRDLQRAQHDARAAVTDLNARKADVRAARAALPSRADGPQALPLARLMATHESVQVEWMSYETDPAKAIAYPSMTDAREPLTAVFLREQQQAQWLRPSSAEARMAPADYTSYRDAVRKMARAFAAAQREAWRRNGEQRGDEPRTGAWAGMAQDLWENVRSVSAAARAAAAAWPRKRPPEA